MAGPESHPRLWHHRMQVLAREVGLSRCPPSPAGRVHQPTNQLWWTGRHTGAYAKHAEQATQRVQPGTQPVRKCCAVLRLHAHRQWVGKGFFFDTAENPVHLLGPLIIPAAERGGSNVHTMQNVWARGLPYCGSSHGQNQDHMTKEAQYVLQASSCCAVGPLKHRSAGLHQKGAHGLAHSHA